jgi:hypothetical protein
MATYPTDMCQARTAGPKASLQCARIQDCFTHASPCTLHLQDPPRNAPRCCALSPTTDTGPDTPKHHLDLRSCHTELVGSWTARSLVRPLASTSPGRTLPPPAYIYLHLTSNKSCTTGSASRHTASGYQAPRQPPKCCTSPRCQLPKFCTSPSYRLKQPSHNQHMPATFIGGCRQIQEDQKTWTYKKLTKTIGTAP